MIPVNSLSVVLGWVADLLFGDPARLPHPVVAFGRWIAFGEHRLNHGRRRRAKGAVLAIVSVVLAYVSVWLLLHLLAPYSWLKMAVAAVLVFYSLAGRTLRYEVREVFSALRRGLDAGRRRVARIVGRDTAALSENEVRTAALETLAENLSDGVVAPLFWFLLLGVPGMVAYKMVNTLDSMLGYRTPRYREFGFWSARQDDVANYIPARLTALLMIVAYTLLALCGKARRKGFRHLLAFVRQCLVISQILGNQRHVQRRHQRLSLPDPNLLWNAEWNHVDASVQVLRGGLLPEGLAEIHLCDTVRRASHQKEQAAQNGYCSFHVVGLGLAQKYVHLLE